MYNFSGSILNSSIILSVEDFFVKIKEMFFTLDLDEYTNINIGSDDAPNISLLIFGLFIGVLIASFMSIFNKRTLGDFVRKIISDECFDVKSAKTLSELGYMKNAAVRGSLKSGVTLKRVVRCVEEEEYYKQFGIEPRPVKEFEEIIHGEKKETDTDIKIDEKVAEEKATVITSETEQPKAYNKLNIPPYKTDLNKDHFYIAKNDSYMADVKFEAKGTNWVSFAFVVVISFATVILTFKLLPDILQLIDNLIGSIKPDDNILR